MKEIEKIIDWFRDKQNKGVTYSMQYRFGINNSNGKESYDCSSAIYYACIYAFNKDDDWARSTSTLPKFLENLGFVLISKNKEWEAKRGDIVIWQQKIGVSGATAHTGIFTDNTHIIHCNYKNNGITEDTEQSLISLYNRNWLVYRYQDQYGWKNDNGKWWYKNYDGNYFKDEWKYINGLWFYFDDEGYAYQNKWLKYNDNWYYFDINCIMVTDKFITIDDETFYLDDKGICCINEVVNINCKDYVFNYRGALIKNKKINHNGYIE